MNGTSSCQPFVCTDLQVRLSAKGTDTVLMVSIASTGVVLWSVAYTIDAEFRLFTVEKCCYAPTDLASSSSSTVFDSAAM
ncbi:hypothetical protein [Cupriavidus taiwanensis]|uniref:hypothetical protein n=1 Tax=Cupriavidus taiwanensis TaxID=164546 RepID=UPI0039C252D9